MKKRLRRYMTKTQRRKLPSDPALDFAFRYLKRLSPAFKKSVGLLVERGSVGKATRQDAITAEFIVWLGRGWDAGFKSGFRMRARV